MIIFLLLALSCTGKKSSKVGSKCSGSSCKYVPKKANNSSANK